MSDATLPHDAPDMTGTQFVLEKLIGQGGFGQAYLAFNKGLRRRCVAKFLMDTTNSGFVARFYREAQVMANLDHVAIPRVYEVNTTRHGQPYFVMEYIEGKSLAEHLMASGGTLPIAEACALIASAAEGLAAAHEMGIVHRDIKPANLLLNKKGQIKVIDFGIARKTVQDADATPGIMTMANQLLGTPRYMSPEQAMAKALGPASDFYSLGVVLCMLLTSRSPFDGTPQEMMYGHVRNPAPTLAQLAGRPFPPEVEAIVARMLKKKPEERFANGQELADALRAVAGVSGIQPSGPTSQPTPSASLLGVSPEALTMPASFAPSRDAPTAMPSPAPPAVVQAAPTHVVPRAPRPIEPTNVHVSAVSAMVAEPSMSLAASGFVAPQETQAIVAASSPTPPVVAPPRSAPEPTALPSLPGGPGAERTEVAFGYTPSAAALPPPVVDHTPSSIQTAMRMEKEPARRRSPLPFVLLGALVLVGGATAIVLAVRAQDSSSSEAPSKPARKRESQAAVASATESEPESSTSTSATAAPPEPAPSVTTSVASKPSAIAPKPNASSPSVTAKPLPSGSTTAIVKPPKKKDGVSDEMY